MVSIPFCYLSNTFLGLCKCPTWRWLKKTNLPYETSCYTYYNDATISSLWDRKYCFIPRTSYASEQLTTVMRCLVTRTRSPKHHQVDSSLWNIRARYTNLLGCVVCGHRPSCCSPSAMECPYTAHDCTMQHITGPFPSLNLLLSLKSNSWLPSSLIQDLTAYILIFFKASSCIIIFDLKIVTRSSIFLSHFKSFQYQGHHKQTNIWTQF